MPLIRIPAPFDHPDWVFELKNDGFRALAHVEVRTVSFGDGHAASGQPDSYEWCAQKPLEPLEWRHVDFDAGEVRLDPGTTKNKEGRTFPMTDDLRDLLKTQLAEHERLKKTGHVFPYVFFREVADERFGKKHPKIITSFNKVWKIACRAAGCPGKIPHDLRRTAARNFVRRGVSQTVAMNLTGHKTPSVFQRYNIVSDGDLREAAQKLNDHQVALGR